MRIIPSLKEKKLIIEKKNSYASFSKYGKIAVKDVDENGAPTRVLYVDGVRESAMFLIPGLEYDPVFGYMRLIMEEISNRSLIKNTLLIGGAGYSLPKAYISSFGDKRMTVVESNPEMKEIAEKYFALDKLNEEFDAESSGRLKSVMDEGLRFLKSFRGTYDLIINDAFVGRTPDKGLLSEEGVRAAYKRLGADGLYIINIITALTGKDSVLGLMAQEICARVFGRAWIKQVHEGYPEQYRQNVLLMAQKPAAGPTTLIA